MGSFPDFAQGWKGETRAHREGVTSDPRKEGARISLFKSECEKEILKVYLLEVGKTISEIHLKHKLEV